jgi:hypothetical protein
MPAAKAKGSAIFINLTKSQFDDFTIIFSLSSFAYHLFFVFLHRKGKK